MKLSKIQDTGCYDMLHLYHLQKMIFYNLSNSDSGTLLVFSALEKKIVTFGFDIILLIWSICFFFHYMGQL